MGSEPRAARSHILRLLLKGLQEGNKGGRVSLVLCLCFLILSVLTVGTDMLFCVRFFSAGLDAELYYVRDDVVNHYALSFVLPVPSETNSLHFTWHSKSKVGEIHHTLACACAYPVMFFFLISLKGSLKAC